MKWKGAESVIIILICLWVGGGFLGYGSYTLYKEINLQSAGIETTATVLRKYEKESEETKSKDTIFYRHISANYHIVYEFKTNSGEVVQNDKLVRKSTYDKAENTISVIYDADDIKNNEITSDSFHWLMPIALIIFGIAGLMFPVLWHMEPAPAVVRKDLIPGGPQNISLALLKESKPSYIFLYLAWNIILGLIIAFTWDIMPLLGWIILSPLILIGIFMFLGVFTTLASLLNPVFRISVSENPEMGKTVQLFWNSTGRPKSLHRLVIMLVATARDDIKYEYPVFDSTARETFAEGKSTLTLPSTILRDTNDPQSALNAVYITWKIRLRGYRHLWIDVDQEYRL
ncbi:MAG: hypothetical protein A2Y62_19580 [Candidatus Fischerbacteria bacterium RBG_13_37_8]|uniref:DUF3592 domain-containing protein n=1 Tax=Candidatus Fischerbacteria bacterium RBG_13_37_8 TaxID=1817863 RepID=A0A1F5VXI9_9BACT|nr:MAG: hypothetical protein A2Y62_19580 [Candidatus Fischerbacteria bacterium RBG_13_37_8]